MSRQWLEFKLIEGITLSWGCVSTALCWECFQTQLTCLSYCPESRKLQRALRQRDRLDKKRERTTISGFIKFLCSKMETKHIRSIWFIYFLCCGLMKVNFSNEILDLWRNGICLSANKSKGLTNKYICQNLFYKLLSPSNHLYTKLKKQIQQTLIWESKS